MYTFVDWFSDDHEVVDSVAKLRLFYLSKVDLHDLNFAFILYENMQLVKVAAAVYQSGSRHETLTSWLSLCWQNKNYTTEVIKLV